MATIATPESPTAPHLHSSSSIMMLSNDHINNDPQSPSSTHNHPQSMSNQSQSSSFNPSERQNNYKSKDASLKDNSNHNNNPVSATLKHKLSTSKLPRTNGLRMGLSLVDFNVIRTIGTGTFGRVYLSKYKDRDQFYALKVLRKVDVVRLKQVEHVNSEKEILSSIKFPFIVDFICTFQDDRHIYMLEEYVIGGELFSHLRRAGRFGNDVTVFYAGQILLAVEYLHDRNIIYRDLKPENLLLDISGNVKITDFGFAKKVEDRTWTLCGTPEYLAPEIIQSNGHGKAVDWWALGILIFEMLAGYPPFFDDNPFGIYEKILAGKISFPPHFDRYAVDVVSQLLVGDITRRLGNMKDGAQDIKIHPWFRHLNWNALLNKKIRPPIIPMIAHPGDSRNFDVYPELTEEELRTAVEDPFTDLFRGETVFRF